MPSETGFRVLGAVLNREESYLDVTVGGVDEDGRIYLTDGNGEVWTFEPERFEELNDELLMVGESQIPFPTHQLWTDLENVGITRAEVDINNFVDTHLRKSQEHLFKALLEAGR